MKKILNTATVFGVMFHLNLSLAGVYVSPYASVSSQKKIQPEKAGSNQESSKTSQRTTYGIRAGVSFWRLMSLQLSIGRSQLDKTEKVQDAADDFDEIDYEKDLDMSTDDPESTVDTKETMDKARVEAIVDPGFWIFIARAKAGVQASRRQMSLTQNGETTEFETPISYVPVAGAGLGVRISHNMKAMAEYSFVFFNFPEDKPFEREVSISYQIGF